MSGSKVKKSLLIIFAVILILGLSVSMYSLSKNTDVIKLLSGTHGNNEADYRVASFDIAIDDRDDDYVYFRAYATTKLSDIEKTDKGYEPHSFLAGAYQTHKITVTNNSETTAICILDVERDMEDDRVFYVMLPDVSADTIVQTLYTDSDTSNPQKVRDYLDSITYKQGLIERGQTMTFTMVVWAEHDAVFKDEDGDGIADENSQMLNRLEDGTPYEWVTFSFMFKQEH